MSVKVCSQHQFINSSCATCMGATKPTHQPESERDEAIKLAKEVEGMQQNGLHDNEILLSKALLAEAERADRAEAEVESRKAAHQGAYQALLDKFAEARAEIDQWKALDAERNLHMQKLVAEIETLKADLERLTKGNNGLLQTVDKLNKENDAWIETAGTMGNRAQKNLDDIRAAQSQLAATRLQVAALMEALKEAAELGYCRCEKETRFTCALCDILSTPDDAGEKALESLKWYADGDHIDFVPMPSNDQASLMTNEMIGGRNILYVESGHRAREALAALGIGGGK